MTRAQTNQEGQRGFTAMEVAMAAALLSVLALTSASSLMAGTSACRETIARQESVRQAGALLERVKLELQDAAASSVVLTTARPDTITFRRVTGYDPVAGAQTLSGPITYRCVPMDAAGSSGRLVVERVETGAPVSRLAGFIAASDLRDPLLPGLHFERRTEGAAAVIDVTATLRVPGASDAGAALRIASSVRLAN